jgi:parvulin-like peptidyl-prolyl isomerase
MKRNSKIRPAVSLFIMLLSGAFNGSAQLSLLTDLGGSAFLLDGRQDEALTKLTGAEIQLLLQLESKDDQNHLAALANNPQQRKQLLEKLRLNLSLANEARRTGFAQRQSVMMQLELAKLEILASAYNDVLKKGAADKTSQQIPFSYITDEASNKYLSAPRNKVRYDAELKKFLAYIEEVKKISGLPADNSAEQKAFIVSQWKKAAYGAAKAGELKLIDKALRLQYQVQQALLLASSYAREVAAVNEPTQQELDAFIKENPKFNRQKYRVRAEYVLQKVKAGEDFAALADEFSEDPGNRASETGKGLGGLYDWTDRNRFVTEFSDAAWALEEGQASGLVETRFGYHIIKLEGKRVAPGRNGKDQEQVKVRHILILTMQDDESDPQAQQIPLEDAAKKSLSHRKEKKLLDAILQRNPIDLPEDFTVSAGSATTAAAAPKSSKTAKSRKTSGARKRVNLKKKH